MIGCGHTKISNTHDYLPESNIQKFKEQTHKEMRKLFGDKYKAHYGTGYNPEILKNYYKEQEENSDEESSEEEDSEEEDSDELKKIFKEQDKNHCYGFIYLLYFYILYKDENTGEYHMKLSDSYLPVNLSDKENNKYKFSLVFPMGIADCGEDILVSCGEGDFYSILLKFKIKNIIDACRHDLREINMDNYKFKYLVKKNNSFETQDYLSKI